MAGVVVKDDFPFCFLSGQPGGTQCVPVPLTEEALTVLSTPGGSKMPWAQPLGGRGTVQCCAWQISHTTHYWQLSCMHNLLDMVLEMCPLGFYWLWCATAQHRAFVTLPSQLLYLQNLSFLKRLLSMQSFHFSVSTYTAFDRNDRNGRACLAFKSQTLKQSTAWSFLLIFFKANCISSSWEITALQMKFTLEINKPS